MADEWGFVPFAGTAGYPDMAKSEGAGGKRSQKTEMRRRQKLEKLVAGIVKLPASGAAAIESSEASGNQSVCKKRIPSTKTPSSEGHASKTAGSNAGASLHSAMISSSKEVHHKNEDQHITIGNDTEHPGAKVDSKRKPKRKANMMETGCTSVPQNPQVSGDQQLSRKQQKRLLRQQLYEARKHGYNVNASEEHHGQIDATRSPQAAPSPSEQQMPARAHSNGIEASCTQMERKVKPKSWSAKHQKKLVRGETHSQQQPLPTTTKGPFTASERDTKSSVPAQQDKPKRQRDNELASHSLHRSEPQPRNTSVQRLDASNSCPVKMSRGTSSTQIAQNVTKSTGLSADKLSHKSASTAANGEASRLPPQHQPQAGDAKSKTSSGLLGKMRAKLQGGRFRWLNEQMYSSTGDSAYELMQGDPDLYHQYHEGFRRQAADWPLQPVELAVAWLKTKPDDWVVADFGCGDAQIAAKANQRVHSFDLVAEIPGVVACNMASVPLPSASANAAMFCLALMGTDYGSFLEEAHRVLKTKGWLWVCEVRSRFSGQGSSATVSETESQPATSWVMVGFTQALQHLGFRLTRRKVVNKMFVIFELQKTKVRASGAIDWPELKGCVYRKR